MAWLMMAKAHHPAGPGRRDAVTSRATVCAFPAATSHGGRDHSDATECRLRTRGVSCEAAGVIGFVPQPGPRAGRP
jgi:hypothetical protein